MVNLPEQYFLLLDCGSKIGRKISSFHLARAVLEELVLSGSVQVINNLCYPTLKPAGIQDPVLKAVFSKIEESVELKTVYAWASSLSRESQSLKQQIADSLVEKGMITLNQNWYSKIIPVHSYKIRNIQALREILMRLRSTGLYCRPCKQRDMALLWLLKQAGQLNCVFYESEQKIVLQSMERYDTKRLISMHW